MVNSVGFPIVACGIMFANNTKLTNALHGLNTTMKVIEIRLSDLEKGRDSNDSKTN